MSKSGGLLDDCALVGLKSRGHVLWPVTWTLVCGQCEWYWGALSWEEATMWLADLPDGSFLVRDSSDYRYILSLSFRSQGRTHHTRIEHYKGKCARARSHTAAPDEITINSIQRLQAFCDSDDCHRAKICYKW